MAAVCCLTIKIAEIKMTNPKNKIGNKISLSITCFFKVNNYELLNVSNIKLFFLGLPHSAL